MILRDNVSDDLERHIHGYFIDLCLIDHRILLRQCLRELVFSNLERMKEVREEMDEAACTGDRETLAQHLEFGHSIYMNPFHTEYSTLDIAIMYGQYECVEVLLHHAGSHREVELCGDGPVVLALQTQNMEILRLLLERGFNPWGTDNANAIAIIEWGSLFDALQIYVDCGVNFSAVRLLKMGCTNIMGYLMKRGYDPTEELIQRDNECDWWGSRSRLFRLIYVSCFCLDQYNRSRLFMLTDHDEVEIGGGLLEFDRNNRELRELLEVLRDSGLQKYSFLWLQE